MKRQSKEDEFIDKFKQSEARMKDRDLDFDKKFKEVEQIKVKVDEKYTQMRKEKEENLKRMDLMDSEIQ